jgi:hypothetical protein
MDKTLYLALRLRAASEERPWQEIGTELLRQALAPEIDEVSGVPPLAAMIQTHLHGKQPPAREAGYPAKAK